MLSKLSNRKLMLVIEDDELIQDLIKRYLANSNVEIVPAYDGNEGVEKYKYLIERGKRPDIVVVDIGLPFKNGIEATKEILSIDPSAKIYGFTAFYGTEKAKKLLEAGAKKIISRSLGFETFRNIIEEELKKEEIVK
ncbi:MAG: response regulator [Thermoplasmatales archaeon]|nr:response regulator [Thermoplasmatales archaeon]